MTLGFAFYAKWFKTAGQCDQPIGCPTVLLEDANGGDTGQSGAVTFHDGVSVMNQGKADETQGGQWYWDPSTSYFWTWDTPEFIAKKIQGIIKARGLSGASKSFLVSSFDTLLESKATLLITSTIFRILQQ